MNTLDMDTFSGRRWVHFLVRVDINAISKVSMGPKGKKKKTEVGLRQNETNVCFKGHYQEIEMAIRIGENICKPCI